MSNDEALQILRGANKHSDFQASLDSGRWAVDRTGGVDPRSICWLFCWTVGAKGTESVCQAYRDIVPITHAEFLERVGRQYARTHRNPTKGKEEAVQAEILRRLGKAASIEVAVSNAQCDADDDGEFNPDNKQDERKRTARQIACRRGQAKFREKLLAAYSGRCAITDCDAEPALEAAHIRGYLGDKEHHVTNGLILRADIHTLYDLDLIAVHPSTLVIHVGKSLKETEYATLLEGRVLRSSVSGTPPNHIVLLERWDRFEANEGSVG